MKLSRFCRGMAAGALAFLILWASSVADAGEAVVISSLDLERMTCGYKSPQKDKSVEGGPVRIAGKTYERGVGTHAESALRLELGGKAEAFRAVIGIDDEAGTSASAQFIVVLDDEREAFDSGVMKKGESREIDLDIRGAKAITLKVLDGDDGETDDHADWGDAQLTMESGTRPYATEPEPEVREEPFILTPKPGPGPKINGPKIYGQRPNSTFLFKIAATGERPMTFEAKGLPEGLSLDSATGIISGEAVKSGEFEATLFASNSHGVAKRGLKIVIGEELSLTPAMGWSSWNCWAGDIDQAKILSAAKAIVEKGLDRHGWSYVNIDDGWQGLRGGEFNALQPNKRFPDIRRLAGEIHSMGLKFGIYSTPWTMSFLGHAGSSCDNGNGVYDWIKNGQHSDIYGYALEDKKAFHKLGRHSFATKDAKQWAAWGVDYLKYDWAPNEPPQVKEMHAALRGCGRDLVLSLSCYNPMRNAQENGKYANSWRTTGDIVDTWTSVSGIGFKRQDGWLKFARPGHWNDPDMMVIGKVVTNWKKGGQSPTRLTPNEQYSHVSLWCLLSAPLIMGCNLPEMDEFTLNLVSNDEVIAVDQDTLGIPARKVCKGTNSQVWAKPLDDGSIAVGLFNLGAKPQTVSVAWNELGVEGRMAARDLWRQCDLGEFAGKFEAEIPRHGVKLITLRHPDASGGQ